MQYTTINQFLKHNPDIFYEFTPNNSNRVQLKITLKWSDSRHKPITDILRYQGRSYALQPTHKGKNLTIFIW